MKKRDLEKKLRQSGWWLARHGGNHDIWTNGKTTTQVPRHPEINELLAKSIVREAEKNPGERRDKYGIRRKNLEKQKSLARRSSIFEYNDSRKNKGRSSIYD